MPQKRVPTIVRFFAKIEKAADLSGCWLWTGARDQDGYGIFWDGTYRQSGAGHYVRVTRWAYAQFVGPIPAGQQLLHSCDHPSCVNVAHLSTGTAAENHQQREARGRGVRKHGSAHVGAKLTEEQVLQIRAARAAGATNISLADQYGVTNQLISVIVNRKAWTHI